MLVGQNLVSFTDPSVEGGSGDETRQNPVYIYNIVVLCLIGRQPKSPSKRTQSGTIYSILKSLLSKDKENVLLLLNMKELRPYLCQEGILPLVTFTKYSDTNMSVDDQSADYLQNVLTRKQDECLKFLFCLQSEKGHLGHKHLLDHVLTHCNGKYEYVYTIVQVREKYR